MAPIFVGSDSINSNVRSDRVGFAISTSNPGSSSEGDSYFNSTNKQLNVYDGSAWSSAGAGGNITQLVASGTLSDGQPVIIQSDGKVASIAPDGSNLTSSNFIGFSDAAYTNGQTAKIQIAGSVDDAQTGLTTGSQYYVQTNGTLSTSAGSPSVFAGTAVSGTKIIVLG